MRKKLQRMRIGMTDLYDKNIASFYNDVAKDYDKVYSSDVERAENEILADYLSQIIRPDDRVLDVGTGTGLLLDLVDIPKDNFLGIDISPKMIDQARELFPKHRFEVLNGMEFSVSKEVLEFQPNCIISLFGMFDYYGMDWLRLVKDYAKNSDNKFTRLFTTMPNNIQKHKIHDNNSHSFPPTSHKVDFQEMYEFMDERCANEEVNHVFLHGFSYESLNHLNPSSVRVCSEYIKDSMDDYEQSKYALFYSNFINNER